MIEAPPLLTIKRPSLRPTAAQIAAFQDVPTGFVVDAMMGSGAMVGPIRPLDEGRDLPTRAVGPALTVENGPADVLALLASPGFVQAGDVVVSGVSGHQGCAAVGDRVSAMLKNAGAVGIVTDGPARDYDGIVEVGLPTWCTGLNPNSPYDNGPGKVGLPLQIGGLRVETGDMIVADFDGVVVVPFAQIDAVIAKLGEVARLEEKLDAEVRGGLTVRPAIEELLASDNVRYVD